MKHHRISWRSLFVLAFVVISCRQKGFVKAPETPDEIRTQVGEFTEANTLYLVEPQSSPEDLLGRSVLLQKDSATIADARNPGCEVVTKNTTGGEFTRSYHADLATLTTLSGGYIKLLQLAAAYGRGIQAELEITNTESLSANTSGPCGEFVITAVKIGYGTRKLLRKAEGSGGGGVDIHGSGLTAGHQAQSQIDHTITWTKPQAYAVAYTQVDQVDRVELNVDIPNQVRDGAPIDLKIMAKRNAYMIAYYIKDDLSATVLVPSQAFPEPRLFAGETRTIELAAALSKPEQAVRETLVIYALANEADYQQFRPKGPFQREQGLEYAARLTKELSNLPLNRWTRTTVSYQIVPK